VFRSQPYFIGKRLAERGVDAYAIMYAYGRSLVHSLTNPKFIKTIQGILNDGKCVRQDMLNSMSL
jgi:hypothetical protein